MTAWFWYGLAVTLVGAVACWLLFRGGWMRGYEQGFADGRRFEELLASRVEKQSVRDSHLLLRDEPRT